MTILLALALTFVVVLLAVVALPLHARAQGSIHDASIAAFAEVDWLGVLAVRIAPGLGVTVQLLGRRIARFALPKRRAARTERKRPEAVGRGAGKLPAVARHRGSLVRMATRLVGALRLRFRVRGTLGTGDPADTAALEGAARLLDGIPGVELAIDWDWTDEAVEIEAECSARLWLLHVLAVAASLLWAREHRAALRAVTAWGMDGLVVIAERRQGWKT